MTLTQAEMEARYDAMKSGAAYIKPTCTTCSSPLMPNAHYCDNCGQPAGDLVLATAALIDQVKGDAWEDEIACEIDRVLAYTRAAAAPTMREKIEILMSAGLLPSGDQLFDLMLEDQVAHYVWMRCIDWVLWRQAHGKPVKRLADADDTSIELDARHDAARLLAGDLTNYGPDTPDDLVYTLCAGEMIERWERTPEQEAQIDKENQLMIDILTAIDGGE